MGFPSKYNEFIESANVSSHVRPRSASAAIGPNGPESAAMVCAMQVRAGKSVKVSVLDKPSTSDAPHTDLQVRKRCASINNVSLQNDCDASVVSKSHGRCWFDTDSETSGSSDIEELTHDSGNCPAQSTENSDLITSFSDIFSRSPPCNRHSIFTGHESSTDGRFLPVSTSVIDFQDFGSNSSVQNSDCNDGVISTMMNHSFLPEAFAPTVMPWFKIKRKLTNK
jgi:hypothetical protein